MVTCIEFSCDVCTLGEDWFLLILALTSLLDRLKFALYASMRVLLVKVLRAGILVVIEGQC